MRSTQIRTPDRTLVSLPNGKLADMRIEDFAARDRIRFAATLGLVYGTSEEQLRQRRLRASRRCCARRRRSGPRPWSSSFVGFGASSLDVEVLCWFETPDFAEFRALRQQVLFGIMRVVREAGTSFAFPTRTLHVSVGRPPARAARLSPRPAYFANTSANSFSIRSQESLSASAL